MIQFNITKLKSTDMEEKKIDQNLNWISFLTRNLQLGAPKTTGQDRVSRVKQSGSCKRMIRIRYESASDQLLGIYTYKEKIKQI